LNSCVAIERSVSVFKGVAFDQRKSRRMARLVLIILPILIMMTIIHEPFHRDLFEYKTERYKLIDYEIWRNLTIENRTEEYEIENHVLCITRYSRFMQDYNTMILFFHLIAPFMLNFLSALYIIFGNSRRRSTAQTKQTYKEHLRQQFNEHKHLIISSIILLILALPRLIIAFVSGCVNPSDNLWLYLSGYLISFIPSILIFVIYVPPSELYKEKFKESLQHLKQKFHL
jgi:hypothetical protein